MSSSPSARVRAATSLALAGLTAFMATGGLFGGRATGSLDQLVVTQYRYNTDETHDITRVYGRVDNTGDKRTPAADLVVTLRSRSGAMQGENRVAIPSLNGAETHEFSLNVEMHGEPVRVDMQVVPTGEATRESKEDS